MEKEKKNLTLKYVFTQFTYWMAGTGATCFATTYLLSKGISPSAVGILVAATGLLSCVTQPLLASAADKAGPSTLNKILPVMSCVCLICFAIQLIPGLGLVPASVCYAVSMWISGAMLPLLNALCVACNESGYTVNYGAARGLGSAASAFSSLIVGVIISRFGTVWMLIFLMIFRVLNIFSFIGYPSIQRAAASGERSVESCSILYFFAHYKWYCISLLAFAFFGMYLAMTENYLIAVMGKLGGDSSHVGTALFISSMISAPVIFFFSAVRKRARDISLLKIAALSFLLRSVLVYFAGSISAIYLIQLLHVTSYSFMHPTQVYYANAKVRSSDMVKGQAFITAAYSLGCSAGNFTGGQLLTFGIEHMLIGGIVMTVLGTLIMFLTVNKTDIVPEQTTDGH